MKDIIITAQRKKTEIITFLICFLMANLANLYAIIRYDTSFLELFTSIGYVLITSILLYAFWTAIRIAIYAGKIALKKKK